MPELSEQTMSDYFGADYAWQVADCCPSTLLHLPADRVDDMLAAYPGYLSAKYRLKKLGGARSDGVYAKSSFDKAGDLVLRSVGGAVVDYHPEKIAVRLRDKRCVSLGEELASVVSRRHYRERLHSGTALTFPRRPRRSF